MEHLQKPAFIFQSLQRQQMDVAFTVHSQLYYRHLDNEPSLKAYVVCKGVEKPLSIHMAGGPKTWYKLPTNYTSTCPLT